MDLVILVVDRYSRYSASLVSSHWGALISFGLNYRCVIILVCCISIWYFQKISAGCTFYVVV